MTLKEYRESLGLTLEEFGGRLGRSKQAYSQLEKRFPSISLPVLLEISAEFSINIHAKKDGSISFGDISDPDLNEDE